MYLFARLLSIMVAYCTLVTILERLFTFFARLYLAKGQRGSIEPLHQVSQSPPKDIKVVIPEQITPLPAFDFRKQEPNRYRPFLTKGHVMMGIKKSKKEDWIRIDNKYQDRINLRKQLVEEHPTVCLGSSKLAGSAVEELYEEVMLDVLPKRFPTMFKIESGYFQNIVTGTQHCISEARANPLNMLRHLTENVEEDFFLMCPNDENEFVLRAFAICFPQGFLAPAKVGLTVSQIHEPVPGYEKRLKKGVSRCFQRMARGESMGRLNWAIQMNRSELFLPFDGANTDKGSTSDKLHFDPLISFLRCEHHTLTCLPKTGAIVFTVRSYLTPLSVIKAEGSGPDLADACESMPEKFGVYKNRPTWGTALCAWLRDTPDMTSVPSISISPPASKDES